MDIEVQNNLLKKLSTQLLQTSFTTENETQVQNLLNQLNSFNYRIKWSFIDRWTCTDLLVHLINIVTDGRLKVIDTASVLQLIINVAAKQEIIVSNMSVDVILHGLRDLWLQVIKLQNPGDGMLCLLIGAISAVCYGNGAYLVPETLDWLIGDGENGIKHRVLKTSSSSLTAQKTYVQCLTGLCLSSESRESMADEYLFQCLQIFIAVLQSAQHTNDVSSCRVVFAAHKGIYNIMESSNSIHEKCIGPLLGALKRHCVFGLPVFACTTPSALNPIHVPELSNIQQPATPNSSKKKKKKTKHSKKSVGSTSGESSHNVGSKSTSVNGVVATDRTRNNKDLFNSRNATALDASIRGMLATSSESDYSDSEAGQRHKINSFALKIRQMALGNLCVVVKNTNKHVMFGFWNSFIPDNESVSTSQVSLLYCIVHDPAPKARVAALLVLSCMLESSKHFLSLISPESTSTSFVSFSGVIASSIHIVHQKLLTRLVEEMSAVTQVHILKCLASLASNAPYTKLNAGLVLSIVARVRVFLSPSYSVDCQIAALNVFMSLFDHDPSLQEVVIAITTSSGQVAFGEGHLARPLSKLPVESNKQSWLIHHCLAMMNFDKTDVTLTLRVASLQTLTAATKSYFVLLTHYVIELKNVIIACIRAGNNSIKLHACKLLDELGRSLLQHQFLPVAASLSMWVDLLSHPLQMLSRENEDSVVQSRLCDCMSTIGPTVFEQLPKNLQIFCQTLLLGLSGDENYLVRSAAVRCLAVYIMYPVLRKDTGFMLDVASCIIKLMEDPIKSVQCNAAWSFANLTDALVVNADSDPTFRSQLRDSFLAELFQFGIRVFNNKDKVRFNMMRVMGNLLRFCDESHVQNETLHSLMQEAIDVIVHALNKDPLMKVRWNACLACGNFLDNDKLPIGSSEWTDDVYKALSATVVSSKNYKVRIKASTALSCPKLRAHYGCSFPEVCSCIIKGIESTLSDTVNLVEFKFKDRLQEQLCCTLLHLVKLMDMEDFNCLVQEISDLTLVHDQLQRWHRVILNRHALPHVEVASTEEAYMTVGTVLDGDKLKLIDDATKNWSHLVKVSNVPRADVADFFSFSS